MAKRTTSASANHSSRERRSSLSEDVHRLADVIDALHATLDRVRDDFDWVIRNGLPLRDLVANAAIPNGSGEHAREEREEVDDDEAEATAVTAVEPKIVQNILGAIENAIEDAQHERLDSLLDTLEEIRNEIVAVIGEDFQPATPPPAKAVHRTTRGPQSLFH